MVSDYLTDFFNYLSIEKGLSSNTTTAYRRDLERFFHYLSINQLNLSQITPEELVGYISWLRGRANTEFKIGESSIARNVISLRSYFSYLAKEHNYQNPTLNFHPPKGKGGKERVVPIGSYGLTAVNDYLTRSRPTLCKVLTQKALFLNQRGGRLTRQSAWSVVANRAARAGLAEVVTPHSMRHSFATHLLDGGADIRVVQELLGHASVTTTQIYTLITIDRLRESYASAHPRSK